MTQTKPKQTQNERMKMEYMENWKRQISARVISYRASWNLDIVYFHTARDDAFQAFEPNSQ